METLVTQTPLRSTSAEKLRATGGSLALFAILAGALVSTPARALNDDDIAAMMGMLWRLQEPICPSMSFDPAAFVKAMKLTGAPAAVRNRHRDAFARGYAVSTDNLSQARRPSSVRRSRPGLTESAT